jgi:Zn-dependent metalloprotease
MSKYFLILFCSLSITLFSQEIIGKPASERFLFSKKIIVDEKSNQTKLVEFESSKVNKKWEDGSSISTLFAKKPTNEVRFSKKETDQLGISHYKYNRFYNGIPIEFSEVIAHVDKNNFLESVNGIVNDVQITNETFTISEELAFNIALKSVNAEKYIWDDKNQYEFLKKQGNIKGNGKINSEKVYIKNNKGAYVSAYKIDVYAIKPLSRADVYVDATSGEIIFKNTKIHFADVNATGKTKYSGNQNFVTDKVSNTQYRLSESGRGGGIQTYNMRQSTDYSSAVDFTDTDNIWTTVNANQDEAAIDVHWGTELYYDYFKNTFGRNSYDNAGAKLNSYVHFDVAYVNAFWNGSAMTYGDGDGSQYSALTSLDIVCHELTHAVTEHSANLVYQDESGALNESFSDIFGTVLEFKGNPTKADYLMGEDISSTQTPIRSMENPNALGDPDTYKGQNWSSDGSDNGGVHTNSGVQNYWFYLLANGGAGTNDLGNAFSVTGIGIDKAAAIAYRNLSVYLTSNSQYADARTFSIKAATDLYGPCSQELKSVVNAWYAVGVGDNIISNSVIANFNSSQTISCSSPTSISFTNLSTNSSTYRWDFGDGNTSTLTNPTNIYQSKGTYTVKLVAMGSASCGNTDSITKVGYITILDSKGVKSVSCIPATSNYCCSNGITQVTFADIDNKTQSGTEGYQDFSCSQIATLKAGVRYPFLVNVGSNTENVNAYIDYNNNGIFDSNELIFSSSTPSVTHNALIFIPAINDYDQLLRMRVISNTTSISDPCSTIDGQVEDYAVIIQENKSAPKADFTADNVSILTNQAVNFEDLSTNFPTSWKWILPGASSTISTVANPSVTYSAIGKYDVTLIVSNNYGSDTIVKKDYITVENVYVMCKSETTNQAIGTLVDSGGKTGDYGNSENCTFLINTGCAKSTIDLHITSFSTESSYDYLTIYDGLNTSGKLLGSYSGPLSTLPINLQALSGSVFITFNSDASAVYSGFELTWNSLVSKTPPIADFTLNTLNIPLHTDVAFFDNSTEYPYEWSWDFGDNTKSSVQNPIHKYTNPGVYPVRLIVKNCSTSDTVIKTITVQDAPIYKHSTDTVFAEILSCNDSITLPFKIYNKGLGDLVGEATYSQLYVEDFESSSVNPIWEKIINGNIGSLCGVGQGVKSLSFDGSSERSITSMALDLRNTSTIDFLLRYPSASAGCEQADLGEEVNISYSIDNGSTWNLINKLPVSNYSTFKQVNQVLPELAKTNNTKIRIHQPSFSGVGTDNWIIDNLTIEVNPESTSFASLSQNSYKVAPSDSAIIDITFKSKGYNSGKHILQVYMTSNDTLHSKNPVTLVLDVVGKAEITLDKNCIEFDTVIKNTLLNDVFQLVNTGCDSLDIHQLIFSNSVISSSLQSASVAPNDTLIIPIAFTASNLGANVEYLTLKTSIGDTILCFNAYVTPPPVFDIKVDTIKYLFTTCNDSLTIPLTIYNNGLGKLDWSLYKNETTYSDNFNDLNLSNLWKTLNGGAINSYCGTHLNSLNAVSFDGNGTREIVSKPLDFSDGGIIEFYLKISNGANGCEQADAGEGVTLSYSTNNGNTWNSINYYANDQYPSFQLISEIVPVSAQTTNTLIKISQNSNSGSGFDNWTIDDVLIKESSLINLLDITCNPEAGQIKGQDSSVVMLRMNTVGLSSGIYQYDLQFKSNDLIHPTDKVHFEVIVQGKPEINLSATCIDFSSSYLGVEKKDSLLIANYGCDTLRINSLLFSSGDFTSIQNSLVVSPNDSVYVVVEFLPTKIKDYDEKLTIKSNLQDTVVCLKAKVTNPPTIVLDRDTLVFEMLSCNDSILKASLGIKNIGDSILTWKLSSQSTLEDDFEIAYNSNIWSEIIGGEISSNCGSSKGNSSLFFNGSTNRSAVTVPFLASETTSFSFDLKISQGTTGCEQADAGEDITLWYSTDATNWYQLQLFSVTDYSNFTTISPAIPAEVIGKNVQFALSQNSFTGIGYDNWAIDNVRLVSVLSGVKSDSGTVNPSSNTVIEVQLTLKDLLEKSSIYLASNDPTHSSIVLPYKWNNLAKPCPEFSVTKVANCSNEFTFKDESILEPISWEWSLGNGDISNLSSFNYTYTSAGTFKVTLKVCNKNGCETITKDIVVDQLFSLVPAVCTPLTSSYCCSLGILGVELNDYVNQTQDASEGYVDSTCRLATELVVGKEYKLKLSLNNQYQQNILAWVDLNNNGEFTEDEIIAKDSIMVLGNQEYAFSLPLSSTKDVPLRMRLAASNDPLNNLCSTISNGQVEDYTVIIRPNDTPVNADLNAVLTNSCQNSYSFYSTSTGTNLKYTWDFGDGSTSSEENPKHTYSQSGNYNVKLLVYNQLYKDSVTSVLTVLIPKIKITYSGLLAKDILLSFTSDQSGSGTYYWDFGDTEKSYKKTPNHMYSDTGEYNVKLIYINDDQCVSSDSVVLKIQKSLPKINRNILVASNPSNGVYEVLYNNLEKSNIKLEVKNDVGQLISLYEFNNDISGNYPIDISKECEGVYFLTLHYLDEIQVFKLLLVK